MTKEECLKALNNLSRYANIGREKHGAGGCVVDNFVSNNESVIYDLICDHFDNPPLKFEELKEGDWIWDNLHKTYIHIFAFDIVSPSVKIIQTDDDYTPFEPNRLYRKQVEE